MAMERMCRKRTRGGIETSSVIKLAPRGLQSGSGSGSGPSSNPTPPLSTPSRLQTSIYDVLAFPQAR
jgi:hypothetical protein